MHRNFHRITIHKLNAYSQIKTQRFDYGDNLFGGNLVQPKGGVVRSKN